MSEDEILRGLRAIADDLDRKHRPGRPGVAPRMRPRAAVIAASGLSVILLAGALVAASRDHDDRQDVVTSPSAECPATAPGEVSPFAGMAYDVRPDHIPEGFELSDSDGPGFVSFSGPAPETSDRRSGLTFNQIVHGDATEAVLSDLPRTATPTTIAGRAAAWETNVSRAPGSSVATPTTVVWIVLDEVTLAQVVASGIHPDLVLAIAKGIRPILSSDCAGPRGPVTSDDSTTTVPADRTGDAIEGSAPVDSASQDAADSSIALFEGGVPDVPPTRIQVPPYGALVFSASPKDISLSYIEPGGTGQSSSSAAPEAWKAINYTISGGTNSDRAVLVGVTRAEVASIEAHIGGRSWTTQTVRDPAVPGVAFFVIDAITRPSTDEPPSIGNEPPNQLLVAFNAAGERLYDTREIGAATR